MMQTMAETDRATAVATAAGAASDLHRVERPVFDYFVDPVDGCQLVTAPVAARLMGVGIRTMHGWIARGWVEIRRTPSGVARIVVASLWKREPARSTEATGTAA